MPRPASGGSRRPNRTDFLGQKEIPDSVRSRKEKFFKMNSGQKLTQVSVFDFTFDIETLLWLEYMRIGSQ